MTITNFFNRKEIAHSPTLQDAKNDNKKKPSVVKEDNADRGYDEMAFSWKPLADAFAVLFFPVLQVFFVMVACSQIPDSVVPAGSNHFVLI
jgi:hypothetical protein